MATWPSTLPNPSAKGYKIQSGNQVIRSDMDSGLARQRRRFTSRIDVMDIFLEVTASELDIFEGFIYNDCDGGAAWFDAPIIDGNGIRNMECRLMNGQYTAVPLDTNNSIWNLRMQFEVRNR